MDRRTLEEIKSILGQVEDLRRRLDQLLAQNGLPALTGAVRGILDDVEQRVAEKAAEEFRLALARVNFEDREYQLLRVIDGDTIVVRPPDELTRWMKDVHIRLYGVDAPESNTELGPTYAAILEKLCQLNECRLHIVWERERETTNYAGYPTTSFERGIGSVFVEIGDGYLLYINAILASLPDVRIDRSGRGLIRAARHLTDWPRPLWHHWHRHWPFHAPWPWSSYPALRMLEYLTTCDHADLRRQLHPPHHRGFVWALRKETVLRPTEGLDTIERLFEEWREFCGCPICWETAHELAERWRRALKQEDATPFDLLLLLAYAWSHEPESEVSES